MTIDPLSKQSVAVETTFENLAAEMDECGSPGWAHRVRELGAKANLARDERAEASPKDLRKLGWAVAVHNDYRQHGEHRTFWLFTHRDGTWIKGEGTTDAEALNKCRAALNKEAAS